MDPSAIGVLLATSLVLALIGVPLWLEKVPPNRIYGFRTPRTTSDERLWYPANKVLGRDISVAGIFCAVFGLLALAGLSIGIVLPAWLLLGAWLVPIVAATAHATWAASVTVAEIDGLIADEKKQGRPTARRAPRRETDRER